VQAQGGAAAQAARARAAARGQDPGPPRGAAEAAEARAAVNNVVRRRKWEAFKQKALFWRKAPKPDLPKDQVKFKFVDYGIQNSLDGDVK